MTTWCIVRDRVLTSGRPAYRVALTRGVADPKRLVRRFRPRYTRDAQTGQRKYERGGEVLARAQAFADALCTGGAARERALRGALRRRGTEG